MRRLAVSCGIAILLSGCVTTREPDAGQRAFSEAAGRCNLAYLGTATGANPNFHERLPLAEADRRFACMRAAMGAPAIANYRNLDAAAHMVTVAELATKAVARGADPALAEMYYSRELIRIRAVMSRRSAAEEEAEAEEMQRLSAALGAFGRSMQRYGEQTHPNRLMRLR